VTLQNRQELELGANSPAIPAALAALVLALEECGALSRERYRDLLLRFWTELPEDDAFDHEAQTCERLLAYLDGSLESRDGAGEAT